VARNIIAILRGVKPEEVESIAEAVFSVGINQIEVPLNSPHPLKSIERLAAMRSESDVVGAGTVLTVNEVSEVKSAGGQLIVSPNCNPDVIQATKKVNMISMPGVFTASECFSAIAAGADGLKLFPASKLGVDGMKALQAVLPQMMPLYAVSGVPGGEFANWCNAGIAGFGIGSDIYKAGMSAPEVKANAERVVAAYDAAVELT